MQRLLLSETSPVSVEGASGVLMKDADPSKEVQTHTGQQGRSLKGDLELLRGRR